MLDQQKRQYYLYVNNKQLGPYNYKDVNQFIAEKKITRGTYIFREGMKNWECLGELPEFNQREVIPPPALPQGLPPNALKEQKMWLVFESEKRQGAFTSQEIKILLKNKKIRRGAYAWREGMQDWKPLMTIPEFYEECYPGMPKRILKVDGEMPPIYTDQFKTTLPKGKPSFTNFLFKWLIIILAGVMLWVVLKNAILH